MVVAGVEATERHDEAEVVYLCNQLRAVTLELGTLAMRDAASFLEKLWSAAWNNENPTLTGFGHVDWDTAFEDAPIFLL